MAANTELTTQQARVNKVEADIREAGFQQELSARVNKTLKLSNKRTSKPPKTASKRT